MARTKIVIVILPLIFFTFFTNAQVIGFRLAANSGVLLSEFGTSDVPKNRDQYLSNSTDHFIPQPTIGIEGEVLFQISPSSFFGIELDYTSLKGFNDNPPIYNYFLPEFYEFHETYYPSSIKYKTTLINVAVNYKYFFLKEQVFQPFIKITGVVAFVGTDLTYKDLPAEPITTNILYSRGTSSSEQKKWPVFHMGGGLGFSYDINQRMAFQIDGTATVVNSGIVDGVPNFTYIQIDGENFLRYNRRLSLTTQISIGMVYTFEVESGGTGGGRTSPDRPFYRKNN